MLNSPFRFSVLLAIIMLMAGCKKDESSATVLEEPVCEPVRFNSTERPDVYIVIMKADGNAITQNTTEQQVRLHSNRLLQRKKILNSQLSYILNNIKGGGFITRLTRAEARALQEDEEVELVEKDRVIALGTDCLTVLEPSTAQWGVRRTGADNGDGKRVWIIDTGVDSDHPDLNVDKILSRSFVNGETSIEDENGHGTHVAGIIGALNDSRGVLGVAPGASIIALRALNSDGEGNVSALIRALNYVGQNAQSGEVVNMSLGADTISASLDNAVRTLAERGILFSVAAGNDSKQASLCSPARVNHPNVFTVSAIDSLGNFASFSNFGNDAVDFAAPGVRIVSTYTEGRYARLNGTSMAAPHVAGILLTKGRNISSRGFAQNDPDGEPDRIASY